MIACTSIVYKVAPSGCYELAPQMHFVLRRRVQMNQRFTSTFVAVSLALALGTQLSVEPTVGQEKSATKSTEKAAATKPRGRLPAYYAQVGLSTAQRETIYSVQADYGKQIEALQKQIEAIQKKQDADVVAVLKPEQKEKLDKLLADAQKRAEERRSKSKK